MPSRSQTMVPHLDSVVADLKKAHVNKESSGKRVREEKLERSDLLPGELTEPPKRKKHKRKDKAKATVEDVAQQRLAAVVEETVGRRPADPNAFWVCQGQHAPVEDKFWSG